MTDKFSRGDFIRNLLSPVKGIVDNKEPYEEDYLQFLPPEFNDAMLKAETLRLGYDPDKLTKNQMAGLILKTMSKNTRPDGAGD